MYAYDEIDRTLINERVSEFRDQAKRRLSGALTEDAFKMLRLQNGVYPQLHAYMFRVSIPYGPLSTSHLPRPAHLPRPYPVPRQDDQTVRARARSVELCRGDPARLQPVRPARQYLQGPHQDPRPRARRGKVRNRSRAGMAADGQGRAGARRRGDRGN